MADIGAALLGMLGGRGDVEEDLRDQYWDELDDQDQWADAVIDIFGSKSAAARALGVPRSTLRGWLAGRTPKRGVATVVGQLRRSLSRSLPVQRERELRSGGTGSMVITGTYRYNGGKAAKGAEDRTIEIGRYLNNDTMDQLIDAYLRGSDADELAEIFADNITDQGFYRDTFAVDGPGGWDVTNIGGLG